MANVSVRYIVDDVNAAIEFYCRDLGFEEVMHPAPTFAMLSHSELRLVLTAHGGGGGQAMPNGTFPEPGGWNHFQLEVDDIEAIVARLCDHGARFRSDISTGGGGKQILLEDPAGDQIELFQPIIPRRSSESRCSTEAGPDRPRSVLPRSSPLATECVVCGTTSRPTRPEPWFPDSRAASS
jgi:catechol 2,3-dioxygenase-like lactoylglutathione lyase family enzyme